MNTQSKTIYTIIVLVVVIALGYYIYSDYSKNSSGSSNLSTQNEDNATTTTITKNGITIVVPKGSNPIIEEESVPSNSLPLPDLNRVISFPKEMDSAVQPIYRAKIEGLESQLKVDSTNFENWISLGIYRKNIGDYEGAKEAWQYTNLEWPSNQVSFGNLGDLYAFYLKDYKKAEENFLQSIKNGPDKERAYSQLADFYLNIMKDSVKAKTILEQGIVKASTNTSLHQMLDTIGK